MFRSSIIIHTFFVNNNAGHPFRIMNRSAVWEKWNIFELSFSKSSSYLINEPKSLFDM
jgi:hypothetical protein